MPLLFLPIGKKHVEASRDKDDPKDNVHVSFAFRLFAAFQRLHYYLSREEHADLHNRSWIDLFELGGVLAWAIALNTRHGPGLQAERLCAVFQKTARA